MHYVFYFNCQVIPETVLVPRDSYLRILCSYLRISKVVFMFLYSNELHNYNISKISAQAIRVKAHPKITVLLYSGYICIERIGGSSSH